MTQQDIPGTERKELTALEAQAEKLRKLVEKRLALQGKENEARETLLGMCRAHADAGEFDIAESDDFEVIPVHKYTDSDGQPRVIKYGAKEKVSIIADRDVE